MTTETTTTEGNPNDKGLPPGVPASVTDGGNRGDGAPSAPEVRNTPPAKEPTQEEKDAAKANEATAEQPTDNDKAEKETTAEVDTEDAEEELTEYPSYGDPRADAVVDILREAKFPVAEANALFKEAIETGDFSKVDVAKLTEKLGKAKTDLVMLGVQAYYNDTAAKTKEIVNAAYDAVGGEANYKKVQAWARQKAEKDSAFKAEVENLNKMFDLNKTAATMAASKLAELYEQDSANSSLMRKQVHGDRAVSTPGAQGEYLGRADYLEQMKIAQAKNDTHEINRLRALRAASLPIKK